MNIDEFRSAITPRKLDMLREHREKGRDIAKRLAEFGDLLGFLDVALAMDKVDTYICALERKHASDQETR